MTTLSLQAKQDFLEKEAATRDPIKAIAEFIWNALDAEATIVEVVFKKNDLGGLIGINIIDDGHGISKQRASHDFENLGNSHKRKSIKTEKFGRSVHGKEGRGRLKFFSLAQRAKWISTSKVNGKNESLTLSINVNNLERCELIEILNTNDKVGTTVDLSPLKENFDYLTSSDSFIHISTIFAPYILQYPDVKIVYNGFDVDPRITIHRAYDIPQNPINCPNRVIDDLRLKVIEWNSTTEGRQIFFGGDDGVVLGSQTAYVTAPNFCYSAYAYSSFFREMADANLLDIEGINDPDFMFLLEHIRSDLKDYFRTRQSEQARGLIQNLKDEGAYPYEGEPNDEIEKREREVFDIATYAVSSHSREFSKAASSLKKMTLTLLKEAVKHNPDALSNILRAVVNLPKGQQNEFSNLLERTELGNIISSSSLIADRVEILSTLRSMVFEPKYRPSVKERGELDALVRDNTWLFGEQFHFTLPEAGLTRVMNRVSADLGTKRQKGQVTKKNGQKGRVDQFLGRVVPGPDQNKHEYLLIELKRPSIKIGRKELDQVEDYLNAISKEPDFSHTDTVWNFFLITSEYDDTVESRINQSGRSKGIAQIGKNYTLWVKTWGELLRESEARHKFIQDKLQIEVSDADIDNRIRELTKSVAKFD